MRSFRPRNAWKKARTYHISDHMTSWAFRQSLSSGWHKPRFWQTVFLSPAKKGPFWRKRRKWPICILPTEQGLRSSDPRKRQKWRKWRLSLRQRHGLEKAGVCSSLIGALGITPGIRNASIPVWMVQALHVDVQKLSGTPKPCPKDPAVLETQCVWEFTSELTMRSDSLAWWPRANMPYFLGSTDIFSLLEDGAKA